MTIETDGYYQLSNSGWPKSGKTNIKSISSIDLKITGESDNTGSFIYSRSVDYLENF